MSVPDDPEALREELASRFDLAENDVRIGSSTLRVLKVRDTNALLDQIDPDEFSRDERLPYWADVWVSSVELAHWCLTEANVRGQRILEIGCGLGLAGIAAAAAGGRIVLSDYDHDALQFAAYNAGINLTSPAVRSSVQLLHLDWRRLPSLQPFDMIIGADIAYERSSFRPLIHLMRMLLAPHGTAVLADPNRSIGQEFFAMLDGEGFRLNSSLRRNHTWEGRVMTTTRVVVERLPERH